MPQKTLFITGASTGIGSQTARAAVAAGWRVGLFARSQDKLAALAADLGTPLSCLRGVCPDCTQTYELSAVKMGQYRNT